MPAYSSTGNRVALYQPGDAQVVWNAESPATNAASQQVALYQDQAQPSVGVSIEIKFSGTPGTFSIQPQVADTDTDAAYVAQGSPVTTVNTGNYALLQITGIKANFMRLFMTDDPSNSVTTTATITL